MRRFVDKGRGSVAERSESPSRQGAVSTQSLQSEDSLARLTPTQRSSVLSRLRAARPTSRQSSSSRAGTSGTPVTLQGQESGASSERLQPDRANPRMNGRGGVRDRISDRRSEALARPADSRISSATVERVAGAELQDRQGLSSRLRDYARRRDSSVTARGSFGSPLRNDPVHRLKRPYAVYHDRPYAVRHVPHYVHTYRDPYDRVCHRIIWPRYHYPVCYTYGPHVAYRWCYPYYHRKYVFVSLGGYWPIGCSYLRYYWYGWHPYVWCGYYPVPREVVRQDYNYYTYNYYTGDADAVAGVPERLEQQESEPPSQTLADTRFEEGVKSFESGDYSTAAEKFAAAMRLAPDDTVLPFAYAQALFADAQYSAAAEALREALKNVDPEKEGVFYPRGLYPDDDVVFGQIEQLLDKLERFSYDADLQLLLGYHLLGVGETGYARVPLEQASGDLRNAEAAKALLALLEKMEADAAVDSAGRQSQAGQTAEAQPTTKVKSDAVLQRLSDRAEDGGEAAGGSATDEPAGDESEVNPRGMEVPEPPARDAEPGHTLPDLPDGSNLHSEPDRTMNDRQVTSDSVIRTADRQPAKKEDDDALRTTERSNAGVSAK